VTAEAGAAGADSGVSGADDESVVEDDDAEASDEVTDELADEAGASGSGGSGSSGVDDADVVGDVDDDVDPAEVPAADVVEGLEESSTAGAPAGPAPTAEGVVTVSAVAPVVGEDATASNATVSLVSGVLDSFAGDGPVAPASTPLELMLAAAARRDFLGGIFGNPITVDPILDFVDGVIYGDVNGMDSNGDALIYTITKDPDAGGKVRLNADGMFSFLPDLSVVDSGGVEQFTVMVSEYSTLVKLLAQIPLLGALVEPMVLALQQMPLIGGLLQPLIGYRVFAPIDVNVGELVPEGAPVAFTTMVTSYDGVQISTNFFPASGLMEGETAATVFNGPGLGADGNTDPTSVLTTGDSAVGILTLREAGYNYVSWDPRGEGASGGFLQLDNPFFEGRDVQHIIDWLATRPEARLDAPGDPAMGMVGGSYGGGIQLVVAGIDNRVEAIVPGIAWNSLNQSIYPTADFKTAWALLLGLDLVTAGARINSQIYPALIQGAIFGFINESQQALLSSSGPTVLVDAITAATLLIQGTHDGLFPLNQSIINAGLLDANDIPVDVIWYCGGHGVCLNPVNAAQKTTILDSTLNWLDKYVNGNELVPTVPRFQWFDQNSGLQTSDLLPSDPAFYGAPFVTTGVGGSLLLEPLCCGGSGPQLKVLEVLGAAGLPIAPALAAPARDAINIAIPGPPLLTQMVGPPKLSFTYSGVGTSRHIFAQLVDDQTDLVLGNLITPVPVELDGQSHTVEIDLESIAYRMAPSDSLTLQIVGATSAYADATQWGFINVSDVELALPTVAGAGAVAGAVAGAAEELLVVA